MSIESFRAPGGAQLYYRYDDLTDPWKDAPTIVLAHGFGGFSARWYKWVPPLCGHFRVVRIDLRGLGLSKIPLEIYKNSWPDTLTLDAIALLDHLKLKKVIWVGEHTGALIGLMLSMRVPDRVHAVCVMGAPLKPIDMTKFLSDKIAANKEILGFRESPGYMRKRGMRQWLLDTARLNGTVSEFPPGYDEWYLDQMAQEDPMLVAAFREGMLEVDMLPWMKDINNPVLWLDADRKRVLTEDWHQVVTSHPRIKYVEIPGTGGQIAYQYPEVCVAEVSKFLKDLDLWQA